MQALSTTQTNFDALRLTKGDGTEYWSARDLMLVLGYAKWQKFQDAIERAKYALSNTGASSSEHITGAGKMIEIGNGALRRAVDYNLSRYAAYLVAMNGDARKPEIAAAQQYFAARTRQAELAEAQLNSLSCDDEERMLLAQIEGIRIRKAQQAKIAQLECKLAAVKPQVLLAEKFLRNQTFDKPVLLKDVHHMVCPYYDLTQTAFFDALRAAGILYKRGGNEDGRWRPVVRYVKRDVWFANPPAVDGDKSTATYTVTPLGVSGIIKLIGDLGVRALVLSQSECNANIHKGWEIKGLEG